MKAYYKGFIIEKDQTIETELYYITRRDGGKWLDNGTAVSIQSITGSINDALNYISSIYQA